MRKYSVDQRNELSILNISFPPSEINDLKKRTTIVTHRVSDDAGKYFKGDLVYAEEIDPEYCWEVSDRHVIDNIDQSPYFGDLTKDQVTFLMKFKYIAVLVLKKVEYMRPYSLAQIKARYPEHIYNKLKADPVHSWRARTGIDMIHREPDDAEQKRTYSNWLLMPDKYKRASDTKCMEFFGVTNLKHHEIIRGEKNISDDPVFRSIIAKYKVVFKYDLSRFKLIATKTPRYTNGHPADMPLNQFGGCYTKQSTVFINQDLRPVMKYYGVKCSEQELKATLIAHELAHAIYQEYADDKFKANILKRAKEESFTSEYLEHVRPNKLAEETFCEYLASLVCSFNNSQDYFRFTTTDNRGIYQAVKEAMFASESTDKAKADWAAFLNDPAITWLKRPDGYPEGVSSWFTEVGKEKFENLTLPKILEYIPKTNVKVLTTKSPGKIIYRDRYQVFVK